MDPLFVTSSSCVFGAGPVGPAEIELEKGFRLVELRRDRVLWVFHHVLEALGYYGGKPDWRLTPAELLFTFSGALVLFLAVCTGAVLVRESFFSTQRNAIAAAGISDSQ